MLFTLINHLPPIHLKRSVPLHWMPACIKEKLKQEHERIYGQNKFQNISSCTFQFYLSYGNKSFDSNQSKDSAQDTSEWRNSSHVADPNIVGTML